MRYIQIVIFVVVCLFIVPAVVHADTISIGGIYDFAIMNVIDGEDSFNKFLTIVLVFGMFATTQAIIVRIICKS